MYFLVEYDLTYIHANTESYKKDSSTYIHIYVWLSELNLHSHVYIMFTWHIITMDIRQHANMALSICLYIPMNIYWYYRSSTHVTQGHGFEFFWSHIMLYHDKDRVGFQVDPE